MKEEDMRGRTHFGLRCDVRAEAKGVWFCSGYCEEAPVPAMRVRPMDGKPV
eukprot:CAMPEP_0174739224 /NCGR_PEP_ID=MMETSP1094-20130205/71239_1 /TAXON_ID=156173 /ORGANISM="Chrysochromulina brevifilum, Strain UTEX LB 985" /LENGTH=50 /DNA_ID=CAMNT_0015942755 /DNA_START=200 /DNA_END=352 /DNA_ORIENTATION=+